MSTEDQDSLTMVVSLLYFAFTILLSRFLCSLIFSFILHRSKTVATCLLDFVTTFQVSACSIENATFLRRYGMPTYLTVLFCQLYWNAISLPTGYSGNPCQNWRQFVAGRAKLAGTAGRMACQLAGGQAAFWFARSFWSVGLTATHGQRLAASASCISDLTVPGAAGFGLEFLGVFADSMLVAGLAAFSSGDSWLRHEEVQRPLLYMLSTWLTYHGLYLTGMYSNPANASAQTLGCRGTPLWLHFAVYWAAPLVAVSLGHRLEAVAAVTQTPAERHEKQQ
ncbi:hypothetical protein BOX15_Mlig032230g1 [Macrostomum lignano]|uniref:Aquaporin n=1 Tax=Macrostomum lignano TaxID=282301 RepID=A0A267GED8_9PLAT|nr:hypothetical protein BOX15_Mlig032230g1 [Macrostomum lignano]